MAEYIEREAAIESLPVAWDSAINALRNAPSDDVAPVVHGQWKASGGLLECQNCGEIYSTLGGNEGKAWDYCPNCGARMDGDSDAKAD